MPSFCQQAAIPVLIGRTDAVCIAATGSGKTGAYLIPAGVLTEDVFVIVEPTQ